MVVIHWKRDNEAGGLVVGAAGDTPNMECFVTNVTPISLPFC